MKNKYTYSTLFILSVAFSFSTSAADLLDFVWSGNVSDDSCTIVVGIKDHRTVTTINEVVVRAYTNEAMSGVVAAATQTVTSAETHLARLTLSGLQANTPYYYGTWVDGVQETILNDADNGTDNYVGQFKTFPTEGSAANFSIALSCGHDNDLLNNAVYTTIKNENPLFYICTGDIFYLDKVASDYDPIGYGSLDAFRGWYARLLNSTAYDATASASLYRALPLVYMWDDHDFGPDDSVGTAGAGATSKLYAHPAYREYVPHYPLTGDASNSIQQAFTVGRIRFLISDLRTDAQLPGMASTRLGAAQKSWLKEELLKANGTYQLIVWVTTVPWNGVPVSGEDRWASYANERTELADFIKANHIRGFCALSGDMHGVGIDDGAYTDFATGGGAGFPIFQAGAMGTEGSLKGGPYNKGARGGAGQYGLFEIVDNGVSATAIWTAKNDLNAIVTNSVSLAGYPPAGTPITHTFTNSGPLIASLSPADDATDVATETHLVITFNKTIQQGTGTLNICRIADDSIEQTIDVTSAAVTVSGTQITIYPPVDLQGDTAYYITLDEGAVTDGSSDFSGIYAADGIDYKKWNFSTPRIAEYYAVPFAEDFESLTPGRILGKRGWGGKGTVQAGTVYAGAQAGQLAGGTLEHLFDEHPEHVHVEFYAKVNESDVVPASIPADATAIFYINSNQQVVAYSNQTPVELATSIRSNDWNFFEISNDYTNDTWSLSVNGTNALQDFPFYNASARFVGLLFFEGGVTTSYFDNVSISIPNSGDSDRDGLPDGWEMQYYGGLSPNPNDPISNGVNNVREAYVAGLNPTNPTSQFSVTFQPGVSNQMHWQSVSGRTYTVYRSTNLLFGFEPAVSNLTWPVASFTDTQQQSNAAGFYKLKVELNP